MGKVATSRNGRGGAQAPSSGANYAMAGLVPAIHVAALAKTFGIGAGRTAWIARHKAGMTTKDGLRAADLGKIRDQMHRAAELRQQLQAIFPQVCVVRIDRHMVEEGVHRRAEFCQRMKSAIEIFSFQLFACFAFGAVERRGEGVFLRFDAQIGFRMVFKRSGAVLLFFGFKDIGGALVAGEQARAIPVARNFPGRLCAI